MAKIKTEYVCSECGYRSPKWVGRCLSCGSWNSMVEEVIEEKPKESRVKAADVPVDVRYLDEISSAESTRTATGIREFDRVLGGGVVDAGVVLAGGEPGIGKSTLFLQAADILSSSGGVLYVSGEESPAQVKMRAVRLGVGGKVMFMAETDIRRIAAAMEQKTPRYAIIDSIQTMYDPELSSAPGSVSQVRGCAYVLASVAKRLGIAVFIIGHVTKEGAIAGPRVLEHIVDTVLYFEGEPASNLRILRAVKNRYGSTDEIGVFEMRDTGMQEVKNPTLLEEYEKSLPGVSVMCAAQGSRPMLIEMQALVSQTQLNIPRRICSGVDISRLYMIAAVLEKKIGLKLYNQDIFINIAGGLKVREYAVDLSMAVSIVSSLRNMPVSGGTALIGEIGLAGEVRRVSFLSKRLAECESHGFRRVIVPKSSIEKGLKTDLELIGVDTLSDALAKVF